MSCGRDVLVALLSEEIIRRVITGTWSPKWPTIQTCIFLQSIIVLFCYRLFNSALWEGGGITHLWKSSCTALVQEGIPRDFLLHLQQTVQLWFSRAETNLAQLGGNLRQIIKTSDKYHQLFVPSVFLPLPSISSGGVLCLRLWQWLVYCSMNRSVTQMYEILPTVEKL